MFMIFIVCVLNVYIILGLLRHFQKRKNARCKSTKKLDGKTVIVTGGAAGIGFRIALDLAHRGGRVIMASPFLEEGEKARRYITNKTGNREVLYKHLDLAKLDSVREFASDILKNESRLDILVNNAGVGPVDNYLTDDGLSFIMQVNYYGHFLLTLLLLPLLKKSSTEDDKSRILNMTSIVRSAGSLDVENYNKLEHWSPYRVYANSKLSLALLSIKLSKLLSCNVVVNSVDPGIVGTRIYNARGAVKGYLLRVFINHFFKFPWEGAQTALHVALDDDAGHMSGLVFADCKVVSDSLTQKLDTAADRLWEHSIKLVKLDNKEVNTVMSLMKNK